MRWTSHSERRLLPKHSNTGNSMDAAALDFPVTPTVIDSLVRRWFYAPSGSPAPIVRLIPAYPWEAYGECYGDCIQTLSIVESDTDAEPERSFVIKSHEITASVRGAAVTARDISLPAKLELIRGQFGIGMKHLAEALGVERPTIYSWQKEESKPQDKRRERIESLVELAKHWRTLSSHSLGKRVFEPTESGESVMDILKSDTIDAQRVKTMLRKWADSLTESRGKLKAKAATMRAAMEKRGIKPLSDSVINRSLRDLSNPSS